MDGILEELGPRVQARMTVSSSYDCGLTVKHSSLYVVLCMLGVLEMTTFIQMVVPGMPKTVISISVMHRQ